MRNDPRYMRNIVVAATASKAYDSLHVNVQLDHLYPLRMKISEMQVEVVKHTRIRLGKGQLDPLNTMARMLEQREDL